MTTQDMPDIEADNDAANRRGFKRRSVLWPATISVASYDFSCQVWNLSLGGARVRVDIPLRVGAEVSLSVMSRASIPAVIAWTEDEALGLAFQADSDEIRSLFEDRLHILGIDG
ncbi:PilZ domain-containing protein [Kordiimonas sp. SCSIO 12610]|uniref:PilZ domain-containing protein n=1 Tax=Kordiimonas sp. SCSIO 12610 TaxID=2829597 RepID=UPI0021094FC5|nr:PilZ domain-containing protein [Kordiimonas sp. SCSIO 12610]UTW55524.1 PilZ domain-containing protein [Kordiimonas sp. SCSIO 12610]